MSWGITEHINCLQKLVIPGVIGDYKSFEVTEIFGYHQDRPKETINFLSLLVAESIDPPDQPASPELLNGKKRIELEGTLWKFGIARYRLSTQEVLQALRNLEAIGEWKPGTTQFKACELTPLPPQFIPSDSVQSHPWNGVLKNNFWEGSHVLELFDTLKPDVKFLLDDSSLLKKLAEEVMIFVRMGIDGLSERLGNVLIQLPVTVLTTKVTTSPNGDFIVEPIWHQATPARQLRISCEKYKDTTMEGYGSANVNATKATFPIYSPGGGARYIIWDDLHQVVLGASAETAFITSIGLNLHVIGENINTRNFFLPLSDGTLENVKIPIIGERKPNTVGSPTFDPRGPWRENRVFSDSLERLHGRKEFIQYGGKSGTGRENALKDIHALLREHGKVGAWLWDPYLDAGDILATLFYCPHKGADLRALTAGAVPPVPKDKEDYSKSVSLCLRVEKWFRSSPLANWLGVKTEETPVPKQTWNDIQLDTFKKSMGDCNGLNLEFRIRKGNAGWPFHDRFLIFPSETGPAKAWSLGTSVNNFGNNHHILQKVSDGELIRLAFLDLWSELNDNEYLVWITQ